MGIFSPPPKDADVSLSPVEEAYAALEAMDVARHVDRVDSIKLGIAAKEKAREKAQARLQEVFQEIRDAREPDGETIAHALLTSGDMPPAPEDLTREKDQLVAGIGALTRQINDAYYPLRNPWSELKQEVAEVIQPLTADLQRRAQDIVLQIESLYADSSSVSRLTEMGEILVVKRLSGTMLAAGRELYRSFDFQARIPVDPSLIAFNQSAAVKAMRWPIPETIDAPSQWEMERENLR